MSIKNWEPGKDETGKLLNFDMKILGNLELD